MIVNDRHSVIWDLFLGAPAFRMSGRVGLLHEEIML